MSELEATSEFKPQVEDLSKVQALSNEDDLLEGEACDMSDLHVIPLPPTHSNTSKITRKEISDYGNEAFLLQGVMDQEECGHYISEAEKVGFCDIWGANPSYRNMTRIMLKSPELAELWWPRILPHLTDIVIDGDPSSVHLHGVAPLLQGTWRPSQLNPVFRLLRYPPGGHFAPHFDGYLARNSKLRSMQACVMYLNAEFDGGSTNFIDEEQKLYKDPDGKYCAEEENILCRIQPEAGTMLIFHHHRLHEGQAVRNGIKYILRTDIMYEKCDGPEVDPKEERALQLAQEAERLEGMGETMRAMELYRKAFKLSPSVAEAYGN